MEKPIAILLAKVLGGLYQFCQCVLNYAITLLCLNQRIEGGKHSESIVKPALIVECRHVKVPGPVKWVP